eukprot:CAMPEP_0198149102 /NCGR_PEP_ID=MMETSP1443-20131203/45072_1 /TAXON_ID=186043 /ORGANISM="Entomoneis sp., Strain CCMP2396" /LENGTH=72 /DNA_ID=CAMNT_0043814029 /DNA_START=196 /DNA_END=414 /DNA_ORIENTATION=-
MEESNPIVSTEINHVLCKNGIAVGRITGKIDGWWINRTTAKMLHSRDLPVVRTTKGNGHQLRQSVFVGSQSQ